MSQLATDCDRCLLNGTVSSNTSRTLSSFIGIHKQENTAQSVRSKAHSGLGAKGLALKGSDFMTFVIQPELDGLMKGST